MKKLAGELLAAFPQKLDLAKAEELAKLLRAAAEDEDKIDDALEAVNKAIDGYGVEAIQGEGYYVDRYWRDTVLVYVNLGDTYKTTVCYDTEEAQFFVGSWGDFIEEWEKEEEEEEESLGDEDEDDEDLVDEDSGLSDEGSTDDEG